MQGLLSKLHGRKGVPVLAGSRVYSQAMAADGQVNIFRTEASHSGKWQLLLNSKLLLQVGLKSEVSSNRSLLSVLNLWVLSKSQHVSTLLYFSLNVKSSI